MTNNEILEKAFAKLTELYGDECDIRIISRFYDEKKVLSQCKYYLRYLELIGRIRNKAKSRGEHIFMANTGGASFIAHLLGATDFNPLPVHEYCSSCKKVRFLGNGKTAFDHYRAKCNCGGNMIVDGYDIPFEACLQRVLNEQIRLHVSCGFYNEAKNMILEELNFQTNTANQGIENLSMALWRINLPNYGGECDKEPNSQSPYITLVPVELLDKYGEIEAITGVKFENAWKNREMQVLLSFFTKGTANILGIDSEFFDEILVKTNPQSYDDLLKLIGFSHSSGVWKEKAEHLFDSHKMSLQEIPAYREDVYAMICDKLRRHGIFETGIAFEIINKVWKGKFEGIDDKTAGVLLQLGFNTDFIGLLENTEYMFSKAHGVVCLRDAIALMFYKVNFEKEFTEIFLSSYK